MRRNPFAPWPLLAMLLLLAIGLPVRAACTAGNSNASAIESTPISDFTVNGDGTVTHGKTGLMWKQCAEGLSGAGCSSGTATTANWANALKAANTANTDAFAGYTDWRLPNRKELESIIEFCGSDPAINQTVFPANPSNIFWSSSSYLFSPSSAWVVSFSIGTTGGGDKTGGFFVRLVRGGQPVDTFDLLKPYSVIYDGNTNTGGNVPTDSTAYAPGDTVTVKANTGGLVRNGYTFAGWNILPDSSGVSYAPGATFAMGSDNVTLYATWQLCTYTISPQSRSLSASGALGSVSITAPSGCNWTAASNTGFITITGMSNGSGNGSVSYSIAANATCSARLGTVTIAGQTFTVIQAQVATVPGAPTGVSATASNGRALISFSAPANTGGTAITGYRFTRFPGGITRTRLGPSTAPFGFTGLTNNTAYTFRVRARNCVNFGPQSAPSNSVTPTPF